MAAHGKTARGNFIAAGGGGMWWVGHEGEQNADDGGDGGEKRPRRALGRDRLLRETTPTTANAARTGFSSDGLLS